MPDFDGGSVEIQITSTADKARMAMEALAATVGKTKGTLQGLIPVFNSINKLAHGLKTIEKLDMGKVSTQIDAVSAALEKMSANLARTDLSGFNAQSEQAAQALNRLTNSFRQLDKLQDIDTRRVYEGLDRLGRISSGGVERMSAALSDIDTNNIATSGTALNSLVNGLNKIQNIKLEGIGGLREQLEGLTPTLTTFIQNLQGINTDGLQRLVSALRSIPKAMEAMQGLDSTKLGQVFTVLAEQIQPFIAKLKEASAELIALSNIMSKMGGPTSATAGLPKVLGGASFSGISDWVKKIATGVKNIALEARRAKPSIDTMFTVGKLYFFFNYTKRIAQGFANMMKSAIDFIEVENLFSRSLGSARNEALRFQTTMSEAFGLALPGLLQAQGIFNNILITLGGINEAVAAALSADITKMAIDFAALYNVSIDDAIEKFEAALTGQTKPIRSVSGMDITQGTLQTYLDAAGINRTVRSLSQMEKRLLIIHALQEQMRRSGAIGAWAQEIENPANQLKILTEQLKEVGRWIGAVFISTIGQALPYINGFVMALKEIIKTLATLVGYKPPETKVDEAIDVGSAEDDVDGVTGALNDLKNATSGIDELNIIAPPSGTATPDVGVDPDILGLLGEYDNLMEGVQMKAHDIRDSLMEWLGFIKLVNDETGELSWKFVDLPDEEYFRRLGADLATKLNEAMANIDWDEIQFTAKKIAENLAAFLNGFVAETDWDLLGTTVGEGINTALIFAHTFLTNFDFYEWGVAIATGLNGMIETIDWKLLGATIAAYVQSAIDTAYGFVTTFKWDRFGEAVGTAVNAFFDNVDWALAGETLSTGILGILTTLRTFVATVDWHQIGEDIKNFIAAIDWEAVLAETVGLVGDILGGVVDLLSGLLGEGTTAALITLASAIGAVFLAIKGFSAFTAAKAALNGFGAQISALIPSMQLGAKEIAQIGGGALLAVAGLLTLIKSVTDLILNWDEMDTKSKIINGALAVLGAAFIALGVAIATGFSVATLGLGAIIALIAAVAVAVGAFIVKLASEESAIKDVATAAKDLETANREVEEATDAVATAQYALQKATEDVTTSQENLRIAEDEVTAAKERLLTATENLVVENDAYINAVDRAEAAAEKLREAEDKLGLSGEKLAEQVAQGVLDYKDMDEAQREVYKAYVDSEGAQRKLNETMSDYEQIQKNVTELENDLEAAVRGVETATDASRRAVENMEGAQATLMESEMALTEKIQDRTQAHWDNELALAAEEENYEKYRDAVVDAFEKGELSADEAKIAISKAMVNMSDSAREAFVESIPESIKTGLDPDEYETAGEKITNWFKNTWNGIGDWLDGFWARYKTKTRTHVKDVGKAMTDGLVEGVDKDKTETAWEGALIDTVDAGDKAMEIHSPSGVTEAQGDNLIEGLVVSFRRGIYILRGMTQELMQGIRETMGNNAPGVVQTFKDFYNAVLDTTEAFANNYLTALLEMVTQAAALLSELPDVEPIFISGPQYVNIQRFARGGFPEDGLFFANHTELIGEVGGRTAVANNTMIVEALEGGVERAMLRALAQQPAPPQDTRPIQVNISGREIVRAERDAQTEMGSNPIGGAFSNA